MSEFGKPNRRSFTFTWAGLLLAPTPPPSSLPVRYDDVTLILLHQGEAKALTVTFGTTVSILRQVRVNVMGPVAPLCHSYLFALPHVCVRCRFGWPQGSLVVTSTLSFVMA